MPYTPDLDPQRRRSLMCFPFIPNRVTGEAIQTLLDKLAEPVPPLPGVAMPLEDTNLALWRATPNVGANLAGWRLRSAKGQETLTELRVEWTTVDQAGFVELKRRVGL